MHNAILLSRLEYLRLRPPRRVIAHSPPPSWIGRGLTSTALSLLYRLFPPQYTYIHASPTRPSFPWLPLFRPPYSDESAPLYGSVPFISHTLSYACAGNVIHIHAVLTIYADGSQLRGEKETHIGAYFWFVLLHFSSLRSLTCTAADCTQT